MVMNHFSIADRLLMWRYSDSHPLPVVVHVCVRIRSTCCDPYMCAGGATKRVAERASTAHGMRSLCVPGSDGGGGRVMEVMLP